MMVIHADPNTSKGDTDMLGSDALSGAISVESLPDRLLGGDARDCSPLVDCSPIYTNTPRGDRSARRISPF